jgi:hypothetical protein
MSRRVEALAPRPEQPLAVPEPRAIEVRPVSHPMMVVFERSGKSGKQLPATSERIARGEAEKPRRHTKKKVPSNNQPRNPNQPRLF